MNTWPHISWLHQFLHVHAWSWRFTTWVFVKSVTLLFGTIFSFPATTGHTFTSSFKVPYSHKGWVHQRTHCKRNIMIMIILELHNISLCIYYFYPLSHCVEYKYVECTQLITSSVVIGKLCSWTDNMFMASKISRSITFQRMLGKKPFAHFAWPILSNQSRSILSCE